MMIIAMLLAALAQDQVDSPEYKGWASFKPGSSVTYKYSPQEGGQKITLKSVGESEVVIETEIIYNGKPAGKAIERKIPAKIAAADAPKDVKRGEEEIEVGGKKLKCRTVEFERKLASGKTIAMKIWANDEIPGTGAQVQTLSEGGGKFSMIASEWEKK